VPVLVAAPVGCFTAPHNALPFSLFSASHLPSAYIPPLLSPPHILFTTAKLSEALAEKEKEKKGWKSLYNFPITSSPLSPSSPACYIPPPLPPPPAPLPPHAATPKPSNAASVKPT